MNDTSSDHRDGRTISFFLPPQKSNFAQLLAVLDTRGTIEVLVLKVFGNGL